MIGSLLQADFEEIIASKNWDELREVLAELDGPDIAELIIDLPPETDPYSPAVYAKAHENFVAMQLTGALQRETQPQPLPGVRAHGVDVGPAKMHRAAPGP